MILVVKTRRVEPDVHVVELIGSLRIGHSLSFVETDIRRLIKEGARKVIIDVSRLEYNDSAGMGVFIGVNGEMEQAGGQLRVAGANGMVAKSFSIAHIDRVIPMDASVEAACSSLASANGS